MENTKLVKTKQLPTHKIMCILFFFYSFFQILSFINDSGQNFIDFSKHFNSIITILIYFVGIISIFENLNKYFKEQVILFILLSLFFYVYQFIHGSYINFFFILFLAFVFGDNIKEIYISIMWGMICGTIFVVLLVFTGTIENSVEGFRNNSIERNSMGFYGLMIFGRIIRVIAMLHILISDKIKIKYAMLIIGASIFAYLVTKTRSELFVTLIIYCIPLLIKIFTKRNIVNFFYRFNIFLLISIPIISVLTGKFYYSSLTLQKLSEFTTGRLIYSANLWKQLPFKFFGNSNYLFSNGLTKSDVGYFYNFVDNGWDHLILLQGLLSFFIFMVVSFVLLQKFKIYNKYKQIILFTILIFLFTVSQSVMFNVVINPLLLQLGLIFKKTSSIGKREYI
ncbi:hypothetical protein IGK74_001341 [Enterococcus sp. AZ150]|uniref:Polysaccharide polymerase n=1 Tax=Enterococcus sulfureus ATCC 49903 TaxID=1140003 RepID=S0PER2_9ENTE|nr:hypothetical protein [Enterococcus sulfureus]EOT49311.1 hypothetical protein OMY_00239 [Enterococcus sulfureus ATCC 49903]EOT87178.1 hypothetical protein I573_00234 [Enterococcus sulfureus ATCC 49903]